MSAILLDAPRLAEVSELLRPEHFYADANRHIFAAILELAGEGKSVDIVTVGGYLRDKGRLPIVGGSPYLAQLSDATPAVAHVADHALRIRAVAAKRRAVDFGKRLAIEGSNGVADVAGWLKEKQGELETVVADAAPRTVVWPSCSVDDIFAKLPPIPYVVQALDLCPGAPALLAAYGYSGKTLMMQSALLAVACGLPVWGTFAARQGRCLHVDFEQGSRLTRERYQRLAAGMLIAPSDIAGRLELVSMPTTYLDAPGVSDLLARRFEGVDFVVIDSLRAACPSLDENDSGARVPLDALTRASERTGAAVVVIHHARKPSRDAAGGAKMTIRGSGAIFDACGSVLVLDANKGEPTRVSHEKARVSGRLADDFLLRIEDVERDGNPRGALVVTAEGTPHKQVEPTPSAGFRELMNRIIAELAANGPAASKTILATRVKGKVTDKFAAIDQLVADGRITVVGKQHEVRP